ncbi:MAG: class III poly(R)-hydroxyalkanoic acid synthase subunit PhaE [Pseudomonadota bacterium]|nr:MAG: class III poly(R)-hydroxyalkanoic acid synthase subunit PhaE [Pseudomonadota bacterium]
MSDSVPPGADKWFEAQRKYWDAWLDLARQTATTASPDAAPGKAENPWDQGLEQWWQSVSSAAPPQVQDIYDKLVNLGKAYFAMGQGVLGDGQVPSSQALTDWLEQLNNTFSNMTMPLSPSAVPGMDQMMAFWDLPADTWQRTLSSMSPFPGDFLQALHPEGLSPLARGMHEHLDRFLSVPAVGYTRESQEQYQNLYKLVFEYQRAMREFNLAFVKVGAQSVELFQKKLGERPEADGPVGSLRALYDIWVDACEEVYAAYVMSDEYTRCYGEMVNALMAVKRQGALLVDEVLEAWHMPTQREITTLHERLQETRREMRQMRSEIEHLIDDLRNASATASKATSKAAQTASAPATGTGAKKSATRKSTARKPTAKQ